MKPFLLLFALICGPFTAKAQVSPPTVCCGDALNADEDGVVIDFRAIGRDYRSTTTLLAWSLSI